MIKKIMIVVATLAMAFSIMVLGSPKPASAGILCDTTLVCGTIRHYSPDNGHDAPITIRCDYGDDSTKRYVAEGESSKKWCRDTDQVYVHTNEEISCLYFDRNGRAYWALRFDAVGWHKITDDFNRSCVVGRD